MNKALQFIILVALALGFFHPSYSPAAAAGGTTYYISPTGNDNNSGTSETEPWATFNRAWNDIYPGDTLILLNGIYRQSLNPNKRNGQPGNPITIKAKNDGKAVIEGDTNGDGKGDLIPVKIGDTWPGPIDSYFVIEGIVARNSDGAVFQLEKAYHNTLRRVSGYNANTDTNHHVFSLNWASNNLVEDCLASGSGRKMMLVYKGDYNIIRRCFADWRSWDGRNWHDDWPWGENINIYFGKYNIIENSIGYGSTPLTSIVIYGPGSGSESNKVIGNKVLGSMAVYAGTQKNGAPALWGPDPNNPPLSQVQPVIRPQPSTAAPAVKVRDFSWPDQRAAFQLAGNDEVKDNLFQDIFAWGSAGLAMTEDIRGPSSNNRIVRATFINNGLDNPDGPYGQYGGIGTDAVQADLAKFDSVQNSRIKNILIDWPNYYGGGQRVMTSMNGEGARLTHRYVDGVLMDGSNGQPAQLLWPWPMEDRIQAELGISVTNEMTSLFGNGFIFDVSPASQSFDASNQATFTVTIQPTGGFSSPVTVTAASPSPDINISPLSKTINPPGQIVFTATRKQGASIPFGLQYAISVTAAGGGVQKSNDVSLLVADTAQVNLPVIIRQ